MVAVGSMEPVISIWELDVVEVIEPVATLGTKQSTKSTKKKKVLLMIIFNYVVVYSQLFNSSKFLPPRV